MGKVADRRWIRKSAVAFAIAAAAFARITSAAEDGGAPEPRPGPPLIYASPPRIADEVRACSFVVPVCVKTAKSTPGQNVLFAVDAAERAWRMLTGVLGLPPPDVDPQTLAYDVYLTNDAPHGTFLAARDIRSRIDRARAFSVVDARMRAGCIAEGAIARELARAILFRVAPATDEATAAAQTSALAELVVPCASAMSADAVDAFQKRPERAVADALAGDPSAWPGTSSPGGPLDTLFARGASLFWSRIDWAYGKSPGSIISATWALSPTMTESGARFWNDKPDKFDVLRVSFKGALSTRSTVHDLFLDSAIARAFIGAADDGIHAPESRTFGDAGRLPLDWEIPWPDKPRRIAPRTPVFPTGASYLVVKREGARPGSRLRVEIEWEEHALFRWAFVKLDAQGHELGRVVIGAPERATEAQSTLVDLDGVDRILIVGANVGDPAYAFDPDDEIWESHAWLLTLAEE